MYSPIYIDDHQIGGDSRCFIIVEVGQAHQGSFESACAYIETVGATGADAIKFQTHLAAFESSLDEPFRIAINGNDKNRYDYWQRMEFSEEQWAELAARSRKKGLIFLSSAFSVEAVSLLGSIGMPAWKIGSGEFRSFELMEAIQKHHGPILLSTGMSRYDEIMLMVDYFRQKNIPHALLQCTSKYPTALEDVGLNVLQEFRRRYQCPIGLSDHSGSIYPGLAAMAQGVDLLELHVILDRRQTGPDATSSLSPNEIRQLVEARNAFARMRENPVDKDKMAEDLKEMRGLFSKSVAAVRSLDAGTVLTPELLVPRKPGTGIPYGERDRIFGKTLKRAVSPLRVLDWEDIDE